MNQYDKQLNEPLAAEYYLVGPLPPAQVGMPFLLRVRVRNAGAHAWRVEGPHPVNLAYHWLDLAGQPVIFDGVRAHLPASLAPGEAIELDMHVEPPSRAGSYTLAIDLVEEGVGWFSLRGVPALLAPVKVEELSRDVPRACIICQIAMINDAVGNHVVNQLRYFLSQGYQAIVI
ncbi:MAG TPA: hypothetical protein VFX76_16820, partial [Roseiflexaceae bacterium]|nr:hypothetical protein [Roseiflexaceae bacterium]